MNQEPLALPLLPLVPQRVERVWGGTRFGAPGAPPVGEMWLVADVDERSSAVAAGPLAHETLRSLMGRHGPRLAGTRAPRGTFPLLIKLIDAADDLSVQVHPGHAGTPMPTGAASKDESWVILEAAPGARILHGLREGITAAEFRAASATGDVERCLRHSEVAAGDVVRVPPGTFHAIGGGLLLLELQEPSDTTYRVWDFNRPGLDGKPRPLHLEDALLVGRFGEQPRLREPAPRIELGAALEWRLRADADAYRIESLHFRARASWALPACPESARVLLCVQGQGGAEQVAPPADGPGADGPGAATREPHAHTPLSRTQALLVPASAGKVVVHADAGSEVMVMGLGGVPLAARVPLVPEA